MGEIASPRHGRTSLNVTGDFRRREATREAEHQRFIKIHKEEEERRARHNLRRRAIKKRELLDTFQRRRLENFYSEVQVTGTIRGQPTTPSRREPRHRPTEIPKDWAFYKRNGFIWSDLGRTPKQRLPLVVPPLAVKRDRECMERLLSKIEEEEEEARERMRQQHERIAAQRERSAVKAALSNARQAQLLAGVARKPNTEKEFDQAPSATKEPIGSLGAEVCYPPPTTEGKNKRRTILSQRQEQLARPREPTNVVTSCIMSGNADVAGLLHADPALKGMLGWHLEDLRGRLTEARFAKYGSATQPSARGSATTAKCEGGGRKKNLPQQKKQTGAASAIHAAEWPYASATVQAVASVEFDPQATLGDEASFSSCPSGLRV